MTLRSHVIQLPRLHITAVCGAGLLASSAVALAAAPAGAAPTRVPHRAHHATAERITAAPHAVPGPVTFTDVTQEIDGNFPAGVCSVTITAIGGSGGNGGGAGSTGGLAGRTVVTTTVTPGQIYELDLGAAGTSGGANTGGTGGASGGDDTVADGGVGGDGGNAIAAQGGGGGGGATFVYLQDPGDPIATAAGGAGGGGADAATGGNGGAAGTAGATIDGNTGGQGATVSAAGDGGTGSFGFEDGSPGDVSGSGGNGDNGSDDTITSGGGGGGGWNGGGGGTSNPGTGGGGGANNLEAPGTNGTATTRGNGSVTFDYHACATAPAFVHDSPSAGTVGSAYSYAFTASGSPAPTFALASGVLPPGLHLSASGVLSGTPTTAGTYTFAVRATNSAGHVTTTTRTITIAAVVVVTTTPPAATPVAGTGEQLPFTGSDTAALTALGLLTALTGAGLRLMGRRRR